MPINVGAKPATTPGGTQNVNIVTWDSAAPIPAGTADIGKVIVTAISGTSNVFITGQPIGVSGTVSAAFAGTADVKLVAIGTTAPVTIVNTPTVTAVGLSGSVSVINTVAISGTVTGGSIQQYSQDTTVVGATGTGVLFVGIQSGATTARAIILTTTGAQHVNVINAVGISGSASVINTVAVSGTVTGIALSGTVSSLLVATGAPFYQQGDTSIGATGTGVVMMGVVSGGTTALAVGLTVTGAIRNFNINTLGPYTINGTVSIAASMAYQQGGTAIGATGTGFLFIGIQSGGTTSRAIALTTTGAAHANIINTVAISGTASALTIPTGGTGVYNGTSTVVNYLQLFVTTSANTILVTSAASKVIIVQSLFINANGPNSATFFSSAATGIAGPLFMVTSGGGMVLGQNDHGWFKTTSGQSLTLSLASSGIAGGSLTYLVV